MKPLLVNKMMVLLTFKDALNDFLKNGGFYIAIGIVGLIIITLAVLFIINRKKK